MLKEIVAPGDGTTRFVFVSGKGGVGKTTVSASIGVKLAREGYRTLIVSTDIQKSLDDVFGQEIGFTETAIGGIEGLSAVNVDPVRSIARHREKIIAALETLDPESIILQQMKADGRTECGAAQAAVFEMNEYLNSSGYDVVIFDTAPTGIHLEKILNQSTFVTTMVKQAARYREMSSDTDGREGNAAYRVFEDMVESDVRAIKTLTSDRTSFILVMTPEAMPLSEVERSIPMLEDGFGIRVKAIVINEVLSREERESSPFWANRGRMQDRYIARVSSGYPGKAIVRAYLAPEVNGVERLLRIGDDLFAESGIPIAAGE